MSTTTTTPAAATDAAVKAAIKAAIANPSDLAPYGTLDRSGKARVRSAIDTRAKAAIAGADPTKPESAMAALVEAKRLSDVLDAMRATKSTPARPETDPVEVIANRAAMFRLAADLLESGMAAPDGFDPVDFGPDGIRDYVTSVAYGDAVTLAASKVGRSAPTHKVETGLAIAFAGKSIGDFMTVADIRRAWVAAGGPDKSDGRISARLFADNGCTVDFVEPVAATATTPKGARLIATPPTVEVA